MSEQWIIGHATRVGVAMGLAMHPSRQSKSDAALSVRPTAALSANGPRRLAELFARAAVAA